MLRVINLLALWNPSASLRSNPKSRLRHLPLIPASYRSLQGLEKPHQLSSYPIVSTQSLSQGVDICNRLAILLGLTLNLATLYQPQAHPITHHLSLRILRAAHQRIRLLFLMIRRSNLTQPLRLFQIHLRAKIPARPNLPLVQVLQESLRNITMVLWRIRPLGIPSLTLKAPLVAQTSILADLILHLILSRVPLFPFLVEMDLLVSELPVLTPVVPAFLALSRVPPFPILAEMGLLASEPQVLTQAVLVFLVLNRLLPLPPHHTLIPALEGQALLQTLA